MKRLFLVALLLAGCRDFGAEDPLPALDEAHFRCRVQPVVTKYCSQLACHGDHARYYTVYARNRLRLNTVEEERNEFMTDEERAVNYAATRAWVNRDAPAESFFLLKAIDQDVGGYYHGGATEYDRGDVFLSEDDPDYQVLLDWTQGATEDPACEEPGQNL